MDKLQEWLNTIQCMDCLEGMKQLPDKCIDLVFADPPYNIEKDFGDYNDSKNLEEYFKWIEKCLIECNRILKPTGNIFVKHMPLYLCEMGILMKKIPWKFRNIIAWVRTGGLNAKNKFTERWEGILFFAMSDESKFNIDAVRLKEWTRFDPRNNPNGKNPTDVWKIDRVAHGCEEDLGHPTPTKQEVLEIIIKSSSDFGDLVLDPFIGSGTTARACKDLGRNFIGFEISKKYCEIANKRLQQEVMF